MDSKFKTDDPQDQSMVFKSQKLRRTTAAPVSPKKRRQKKKRTEHKQLTDYYPNKRLKAEVWLKNFNGEFPLLNNLSEPPMVIVAVDIAFGMFTAFYLNRFGLKQEANVFPILKALGQVKDPKEPQLSNTEKLFAEEIR
ncbi:unnamed protein product [Cylindrotheca closterium]|uniref:Uncharacterized protein n=1 Tax=Cylindrotheca closterium TaxID=2856 RepID=A0AAD2G6C4_9STRA|nr:unnamed protein product [Cylindrotheca closterium]